MLVEATDLAEVDATSLAADAPTEGGTTAALPLQ